MTEPLFQKTGRKPLPPSPWDLFVKKVTELAYLRYGYELSRIILHTSLSDIYRMGVFSGALVIMRPFFLASPLPFLSAFLGSSIDPQVVFLLLSSAGTTFLFVDFNSGVGLWRDLYLCSSQKTVIE